MTTHLSTAQEVLKIEIEGLQAVLDQLIDSDSAFSRAFHHALDLIENATGRVIVTGMGKSGHIAKKIAATFASTGEPASFVHPGEASHGDLGMISQNDIVLALSNSGETPELRDVIAYCGRFDIPLIAITSGAKSDLADAADSVLLLPPVREACEETRAPTTSTTMSLAIGDALAVALLRSRGFTATDFRNFHPGGKLGAALRKVKHMMHGEDVLPLCSNDTPIAQAVRQVSVSGFGCVGVVDETVDLLGIITDGDLRRHFNEPLSDKLASDIMTVDPKTVSPETLAAEALAILSQKRITALFVTEGKKPVGLLHIHDCLSIGVI